MNICKLSLINHDCRRRLKTKSIQTRATTETTDVTKTSGSSDYENPSFSPMASSQDYQDLYPPPDNMNGNEANNYEELRDKSNGDYINIKKKVK